MQLHGVLKTVPGVAIVEKIGHLCSRFSKIGKSPLGLTFILNIE